MRPTDVLLTVDLEFSSGGYLQDPENNRPVGSESVDLVIDGRPNGLPLMLDVLDRHGAKATFFVETAQARYFGLEPMGRHVRELAARGHDAQLHLHPQWLFCERIRNGQAVDPADVTDSMAAIGAEQMAEMIDHGIRAFAAWGLPRPVALRTGNLQVSREVYRAMEDRGLSLASNVGLGVADPDDASLQHYNGRHRLGGVVEVPVFSYPVLPAGRLRRDKSLTITGVSSAETRSVLRAARKAGVEEVVLLTHAHEMVKRDSGRYRSIARNRMNQRRLEALCAWVAGHGDEYRFRTFADKESDWQRLPAAPGVPVRVPLAVSLYSMAQNALNDRIGPG